MENKSSNKELAKEHGLSLYIETKGLKILFDVGESKKFWKNAEKLGLNLEEVNYLILSHGHKDHGGGLSYFLKKNKKAKIYCSEYYFEKHYKKIFGAYIDIGIPYEYLDVERFNFVEDTLEIENLKLFHCFDRESDNPLNESLYIKNDNGEYIKDNFKHELNLIVEEENIKALFIGCAHKGVSNILDECEARGDRVNTIVGGFHLSSRTSLNKNEKYIDETIEYLSKSKVEKLYPCHCTGEYGVKRMKEKSGIYILDIQVGSKINL
ncbi:MAG: MBL fold metallo-hydrolase [Cetobacterium sp.]|uniref:MBL fold metallo-hydrolase n=1 Tax=Cetobacterium sp. TaxID=2071632 RepID=UPI003EE78DEB